MTWLFDTMSKAATVPVDLMAEGLFSSRVTESIHLLEFGPAFPPPEIVEEEEEKPSAEVLEAQERARQIRFMVDAAREEAAAQVRAEMQEETRMQVEAERARVHSLLALFSEERARWFRRAEIEIVELALAIARRVLDRELRMDPLALQEIARAAVNRVQDGSGVVLHVSPTRMADWRSAFAGRPDLEVLADPALVEDACVIDTTFGRVELGVGVQLEEISERFREMVGGPRRIRVNGEPSERMAG